MFPYIRLFGKTFGMYGVMMAAGCLLAVFFSIRRGKRLGVPAEDILAVGALGVGGGLMGGGGLYIAVTYTPQQIWQHLQRGDLSFLGGSVFYGGLMGGVVGAWLGVHLVKGRWADFERSMVPYIPLGHAAGRIGCVLAGCCYGMPYDGPLALYYPQAVSGLSPTQGYFPTPLLEAVLNVGVCVYLCYFSRAARRPTAVLCRYLQMYAVLRFGLEFLRGDAVRGMLWGLSTSQWISVGLLAASSAVMLWLRRRAADGSRSDTH